ncbi:MAG: hypothetical protein IAE80_21570 [Anaerolinea sp.]|nr:hypothetical protein [Anaerolinea sp.]
MNIPFRTGVNMREFAYYGTPAVPYTSVALQSAQLNELRGMGVQLVRIFGACRRYNATLNALRLQSALDLIHAAGMQAIIAINDSFNSEYTVPGEQPYHGGTAGHLHKDYWLYRWYRLYYQPYVRTVVGALANHPAALIWELGNEFGIHPQPPTPSDERAFYNFAVEASALIKQLAPLSLVSTGLVNSNHVTLPRTRAIIARRMYALDTIDVVSLHFYQDDSEHLTGGLDVQIAKDLGKPFYVGEMGADIGIGDRAPYYSKTIDDWRKHGAFTVMPWAFDTSPKDVGVSDRKAFARIHGDYGGIKAALSRNATAAPRIRPLPPGGKRYRVVLGPLSVRAEPSTSARRLNLLAQGEEIVVETAATGRVEFQGYVWRKHYGKAAWSAEKRTTDGTVYLQEVT